ncbi:hypothetical protein EXIGLDRAFT_722980 [Exidia glandulosa HHB12029]|uniref:Uncharacterized protein n=1 Tax=Exidia glandulosa HHB12029 TaxID=1314781 RepID=A0A165F0Y6_EXIGL|nr:hypothetical protein EXIGLDRAFT_722980 [Exidia glandulosa HHB12029]
MNAWRLSRTVVFVESIECARRPRLSIDSAHPIRQPLDPAAAVTVALMTPKAPPFPSAKPRINPHVTAALSAPTCRLVQSGFVCIQCSSRIASPDAVRLHPAGRGTPARPSVFH